MSQYKCNHAKDGTALRYAGEFMRQDRRFVLEALRQGLRWWLLFQIDSQTVELELRRVEVCLVPIFSLGLA